MTLLVADGRQILIEENRKLYELLKNQWKYYGPITDTTVTLPDFRGYQDCEIYGMQMCIDNETGELQLVKINKNKDNVST